MMARVPSGGWREVYRWCSVALPMRSREAATSEEANSGDRTTMTDEGQTERERYAKRKVRKVARDLESAQGAATMEQLVDEIVAAGAELAQVRTEIEEER